MTNSDFGLAQFRLDGKVALITGSTSGIGLAIAELFCKAGAKVVINGLSEKDAATDFLKTHGDSAHFIAADVSAKDAPEKLIGGTVDHFGQIDVLVNNAGIDSGGPFVEYNDEKLERITKINYEAPFRLTREAMKVMQSAGGGSIVNVASLAGLLALDPNTDAGYCCSKAATLQLTRVSAFEGAKHNVRVNALAPSYVETPMTRAGVEDSATHQAWVQRTAMARLGKPEEVANCALFFASDASSYVTGSIMTVDGGYSTH